MLIALCKILKLLAFQCDINTAYLNARRKLVRFIKRIAGFPQATTPIFSSTVIHNANSRPI
jgi:hypothetical protein